ncbi:MAG TPA: hypothetical protein VKD69_25210 [Vicinamibacterales bacterium]|nr:hypothetical protein [Vicinamibacterales bacterium]
MRLFRAALIGLAALAAGGCFQMTTVLKISGDGSGTINHRMIYSTQALAQLRQFAAFGGRGGGAPLDPLSEDQFRNMAASIGPGVTYVSSELVTTPNGQGRDATFAFSDVSKLQISTQPAAPGNIAIAAGGLTTTSESITFSLTREPAGTTMLHIHVPEPNFLDALGSPAAANQIGMVKTLLAGAKVLLMAEPSGTLVRTSSPFVAGDRVTLLEVDLDEVLKDETLLPRLQAAKTQDEAKAIIQAATGLKINLDRDITIEFTPAR